MLEKVLAIDTNYAAAKKILAEIHKEIGVPIKLVKKSTTKNRYSISDALLKAIDATKKTNTILTQETWSAEPVTQESKVYKVYFSLMEDITQKGANFKKQIFIWQINTKSKDVMAQNENARLLMEKW